MRTTRYNRWSTRPSRSCTRPSLPSRRRRRHDGRHKWHDGRHMTAWRPSQATRGLFISFVIFLSRFCHVSVTFLSRFRHVSVTFPSRFRHVSVTFPSRFCHVSVTFLSHFCYISVTADRHVPSVTADVFTDDDVTSLCSVQSNSWTVSEQGSRCCILYSGLEPINVFLDYLTFYGTTSRQDDCTVLWMCHKTWAVFVFLTRI